MTSDMNAAMRAAPMHQHLTSPQSLFDKVLFPTLCHSYEEGFADGWASATFAPVPPNASELSGESDLGLARCGIVVRSGVPAMAGMGAVEDCACVRPAGHAGQCEHEAPADAVVSAQDLDDDAKIEAAARAIDPDPWTMSAAEFEAEYGGAPDWSEQSQPGRIEGSKT